MEKWHSIMSITLKAENIGIQILNITYTVFLGKSNLFYPISSPINIEVK